MQSWEERDLTDAATWVDVDQEVRIEHGYEQRHARPAAVDALCHRDGRSAAYRPDPTLRARRTGPHPYGVG